MSAITTHVLDTSVGRPAAGVPVVLEREDRDSWLVVGRGVTDQDGRLRSLMPEGTPPGTGRYRLTFHTKSYHDRTGALAFYPVVVVVFDTAAGESHYHVPLLLSPFGYSTYRGS
jgi:5-hydroxyisourate hydrolase